jgi:hypothetical protein
LRSFKNSIPELILMRSRRRRYSAGTFSNNNIRDVQLDNPLHLVLNEQIER